jgi:YD repeat-containing protein
MFSGLATTIGAGIRFLHYNDAGQLMTETNASGPLAGLKLTYGYDALARRTSLSLNTQPSTLNHTFAYDSASRLTNVSDGVYSAGYSYSSSHFETWQGDERNEGEGLEGEQRGRHLIVTLCHTIVTVLWGPVPALLDA